MTQLKLPATTTRPSYVPLGGGLDLLTPPLKLKPGFVSDALNWEQSVGGGYSRIYGYERFDGRAAPSAGIYVSLTAVETATISVGDTITGMTSGATAHVIARETVTGGALLSYTATTGAFVVGEQLAVGGTPKATVGLLGSLDILRPSFDAEMMVLAADYYRAFIQAVPGSGPVRGGFFYNGTCYAFRNDAGATQLLLWKASPSGWTAVPLGLTLAFSTGTSEYSVGETVTQGGVSATVLAVALESGTWAGGTAAGRLAITTPTGGNFAAGAIAGGGAATAVLQQGVVLQPNGRVQTDRGNFDGTPKIYGCDGVNLGWQFDGTTLIPIRTGNVPDRPDNVLVHKDHLWFSFGNNLQNSGITTPFNWTAIAGSAAYRFNGPIVGLARQPGDQSTGLMSIQTDVDTVLMYGSSAADFRPVPYEESAGGKKYTTQRLGGQTLSFGDIGIFALSATNAFGNFDTAGLTYMIRPFTQVRRNQALASLTNREKSQYRVFFNDGYGIYMTIVNGKLQGSMPVRFPNKVFSAWSAKSPDGGEVSFFGSDNGFVYQLDSGTSHDGAPVQSYFTLVFNNIKTPRQLKRFRRLTIEAAGEGYADFKMSYELGYGSSERAQGTTPQDGVVALSTVYWDTFTWDEFTWDGRTLAPSTMTLDGTGENIAVRVDSASARFKSLTFNSFIFDFSPRRQMRST